MNEVSYIASRMLIRNESPVMNADSHLEESLKPESSGVRINPAVASRAGGWSKINTRRLSIVMLVIVLAGSCLLYLVVLDPRRFGDYHDDGMYVTVAKALATGQGYRIISLPYEPAQTKFPPFYPFLLSLIWRVNPTFPQNLIWMMLLSVGATVSFLALTYRYLVRQGYARHWQALIVVALTAINWRTVIYATGTYSEMIYTALSLVALLLAEKLDRTRNQWIWGLSLGLILGLAFLTRTTGMAPLVAVAVYFLLQRKFRLALLPLAVGSLFVLAWFAWCHVNRTTATGVNVAWYTNYFQYTKDVLLELNVHNRATMAATLLDIAGKNTLMLAVSIPLVCLGLDYNWVFYLGFALMFIAAGFIRDVSRGWRLLHVYVICYLGLHVVWLPFVAYDRYLLPILPFLLLWLIRELASLTKVVRKTMRFDAHILRKASATLIGLAVALIVSVTAYTYGSVFYSSLASATLDKELRPTADDTEAIEWINANTSPSDVLVCARDPMYYLYTGRKATRSLPVTVGIYWQDDNKRVLDVIDESNGKYLVLTRADFDYQTDQQLNGFKELIGEHPEKFVLVFTSGNGRCTIYQTKAENNRR